MKVTHSPVSHQQNVLTSSKTDIDKENKPNNMMGSCVAILNSSDSVLQKNEIEERSADVIKDFFRKAIAAQSYSKMFSNGANFKYLGIDLAKPSATKASLHSLQHLNKISKKYLTEIKEKTQNLTVQEKILLKKVVDANIHFRHQSNTNLAEGSKSLNITSFNKLTADNISTGKNTFSEDIIYLSNHDFVFFGVEFSADKDQLPLNTLHSTMDFGVNAYIVDDQYPYGYLTLTDHFYSEVPRADKYEHQDFAAQFSEVTNEIHRRVHGSKGKKDIPIFNTKDMRLGLGLHLIDFLRNTRDKEFKEFALNMDLNDKGLDRILNFVFQPEFHVPRMVSTNNFKKVTLREMSMEEAVKASNFKVLSEIIINRKKAYAAIVMALELGKEDVVSFLYSKFKSFKK